MNKTVKETIHAKGIDIGIYTTDFENEYISLTDIARYRSSDPRITIHTWLRGRDIVEFLGLWESLHNPDFKRSEFDTFKKDAGTNAFTFSIKNWNEILQGKGIVTKSGRYGGGIFAHSDIALEFASWLSPEFKLYIIKDYKRLKSDENSRLSLNWNLNRELSKLNYKIHTDAIKENLIIPELTASQKSFVYSDEEISPKSNTITLYAGEGMGDGEIVLKPVEVKEENAYDKPTYITPGMPVKMNVEKGAWFKIGVNNMQNSSGEDIVVYITVSDVDVRIE